MLWEIKYAHQTEEERSLVGLQDILGIWRRLLVGQVSFCSYGWRVFEAFDDLNDVLVPVKC